MVTQTMNLFTDPMLLISEEMLYFHDYVMFYLINILVFIFMIFSYIIFFLKNMRYYLISNLMEVLWTLYPLIILFFMIIPSLRLLYLMEDPMIPLFTIKCVGHQWFWSYEYSDLELSFDSYYIYNESQSLNRMFEVDKCLVLPENMWIRFLSCSYDVIHSWSLPSFGLKIDANPGRLNQVMVYLDKVGVFYGQCSEICGSMHSFMPIKMEVVDMNMFMKWLKFLND